LTFILPKTTSISRTLTPNSPAKNFTRWSVALPFTGAAATDICSCEPKGLPIFVIFADGFPKMLKTRTSSSHQNHPSFFVSLIVFTFVF